MWDRTYLTCCIYCTDLTKVLLRMNAQDLQMRCRVEVEKFSACFIKITSLQAELMCRWLEF
jgi:hypothetical protein